MTHTSIEKSYTKGGWETISRPFCKSSKLSISLDQYCGLSKYIETKLQTTCFYLIQSFFKKQEEVWN